jgi:uncharacterized membrane protein YfcA
VQLELWQWALAALGTFAIGVSKTGIAGLGILTVAVFALIFPTRASVGLVLPLLISADVVAVTAFRRHAVWSHLWRLFPWAALGVVLGYLAMGRINGTQVNKLIGGIFVLLVAVQVWRRYQASQAARRGAQNGEAVEEASQHGLWFVATMGILGGFTTMVANAAGPIMILYLLAMRLPKMEFIGTGAWYFLTLNLFKVPFSVNLGLITLPSLLFDLKLAPFALVGALCGRALLRHIDQKLFENLALTLTALAALKLLFF